MIINIYRQVQQEAFGIVLINQKHQVQASSASRWSEGGDGGCLLFVGIFGAEREVLLEFSERQAEAESCELHVREPMVVCTARSECSFVSLWREGERSVFVSSSAKK